eukprot:41709_1
MVCEVQLLLVNYLWEKRKIHKLYNVMRQKEYFKLVVANQAEKSEQKEKDPSQLKLVPVFNFKKIIKKKVLLDKLYKCSFDSELNLVGVRSRDWFGCVSLDTNKIIFEQNVSGGRYHSHHWIKVNNKKYLTVQTNENIIKMYKVNQTTFEEEKNMEIKVADSSEIDF